MAAPGPRTPRLLRPAAQATYERVFHLVATGLAVNVLLAVAVSPFLFALAVVDDPLASWPFFAALSVVGAPALTGAFACFASVDDDGAPALRRTFWAAYRRTAGRAAACWVLGAAVLSVLAVDLVAVARTGWGPALVPFFASAAVLVVAAVVAVLTVLATPPPTTGSRHPDPEQPGVTPRPAAGIRLRDLAWPCLYLVARRWYLAVANLAVLGLAGALVLVQPMIGMLVACAPLLYVVWANTRFIVAPLLQR